MIAVRFKPGVVRPPSICSSSLGQLPWLQRAVGLGLCLSVNSEMNSKTLLPERQAHKRQFIQYIFFQNERTHFLVTVLQTPLWKKIPGHYQEHQWQSPTRSKGFFVLIMTEMGFWVRRTMTLQHSLLSAYQDLRVTARLKRSYSRTVFTAVIITQQVLIKHPFSSTITFAKTCNIFPIKY